MRVTETVRASFDLCAGALGVCYNDELYPPTTVAQQQSARFRLVFVLSVALLLCLRLFFSLPSPPLLALVILSRSVLLVCPSSLLSPLSLSLFYHDSPDHYVSLLREKGEKQVNVSPNGVCATRDENVIPSRTNYSEHQLSISDRHERLIV